MGVFDSVVNRLTGGKEDLAGAPKKLVEGAVELIDAQKGGLQAMVDKLSASGLGEHVKSWVGTGANLPVTADQIKHALSPQELDMLALKTKLSVEEVTSHLAAALPQIVDKLTPDGKITPGSLVEKAQGLLGKLGFGKKPI
jgi:uncharacterized protein YidB (DUF937 family)